MTRPRNRFLAPLSLAGLLLLTAFPSSAGSCPPVEAESWLALIAAGDFEAAQKRVLEWRDAPGCVCPTPDSPCLDLKLDGGATRSVSTAQLGKVISQALAWEAEARKKCSPLSGSDEVGRSAWKACLERQAENLDGVTDELARKLLPKTLKDAATRMSRGLTADEPPIRENVRTIGPDEQSAMVQRAAQKVKKLGHEICEMRRLLAEVDQRIDNMKRQTQFIKSEYDKRMREQVKLRDDLQKAIDENEKLFRLNAGRDFTAIKDCFEQSTTP